MLGNKFPNSSSLNSPRLSIDNFQSVPQVPSSPCSIRSPRLPPSSARDHPDSVFMPVGTLASVKAVPQDVVSGLGSSLILANTYHLYLRPGHELIRSDGWPPSLHELASRPPYRLRRIPGLLPRRSPQSLRRGRPVPLPPRRQHALLFPRTLHRRPACPRRRHRHGL